MASLVVEQLIDQVDEMISTMNDHVELAVPLELAHQLRDELEQCLPTEEDSEESYD